MKRKARETVRDWCSRNMRDAEITIKIYRVIRVIEPLLILLPESSEQGINQLLLLMSADEHPHDALRRLDTYLRQWIDHNLSDAIRAVALQATA